jgi:S1-C subfamily serine protease
MFPYRGWVSTRCVMVWMLMSISMVVSVWDGQRCVQAEDSPRVTPAVKVIQQVQPAVVPIFVQTGPNELGMGSGAVIHREGYILTADHVTQKYPGIVLFGLDRVPYEIVGRVPEKDLAILKVDSSRVSHVLPIGRSADLLPGEPVVVGGNPGGRGIVFSQGVVSAPLIDPSWPNVLVKSFWRQVDEVQEIQRRSPGGRPTFIQFDATSNRGNSGGPLINMLGELIGVVTHKSTIEEGVNWALPADRLRVLMPYLLQPEELGGFTTGLQIDPLPDVPTIQHIVSPSPAHQAGLREGDVLMGIGDQPLQTPLDWWLALRGHHAGETLSVHYQRGGTPAQTELKLIPLQRPTVRISPGIVSGVTVSRYPGRLAALPDFSTLTPESTGTSDGVSLQGLVTEQSEPLALVFQGLLDVPMDGLFRMTLTSDDGSKLYLGDELVIDNDLLHPSQPLSKWVRLPHGPTPFRVEYLDGGGGKDLSLTITQDIEGQRPVEFHYWRIDPTPVVVP